MKIREIQIIESQKDFFDQNAQIYILSYDMATRRAKELEAKKFNACIADEAHYLKSHDSQRSILLTPILQ